MTRALLLLCALLLLIAACGGSADEPTCYSDYPECESDVSTIATAAAYPLKVQPGPRSVVTPNWPPGK